MYPIDPIYTASMNDHQRAWFFAEYQSARKDEVIGVLLAIFLGGLGIHHFYLRRDGLGLVYLVFSWTGIPMIIAWVEAFFMPSRVRQYNAMQAMYISNQILSAPGQPIASAPGAARCNACGAQIDPTATFCTRCGAAITHSALSSQPAL
jgi:TM2 domain-containing membrane protein YozV